MHWIDKKFRTNKTRYILQALAAVPVLLALLIFQDVLSDVMVASLGASTFIACTVPHQRASSPRFFIGGYCMGIIAGIAMHVMYGALAQHTVWMLHIGQALAVGLALLLMVVFNFEHPSAAALALTLVGSDHIWAMAGLSLLCIILLSVIKAGCRKWMIDLL